MAERQFEKREEGIMGGRGICGIALAVVGILVVVWGATLFPSRLTSPDFMSFATGGAVLLAIGLCLVSELPSVARVAGIWLAALVMAVYLWSLPDLDAIVRFMGLVPLIALAVWLTTKFWN